MNHIIYISREDLAYMVKTLGDLVKYEYPEDYDDENCKDTVTLVVRKRKIVFHFKEKKNETRKN